MRKEHNKCIESDDKVMMVKIKFLHLNRIVLRFAEGVEMKKVESNLWYMIHQVSLNLFVFVFELNK